MKTILNRELLLSDMPTDEALQMAINNLSTGLVRYHSTDLRGLWHNADVIKFPTQEECDLAKDILEEYRKPLDGIWETLGEFIDDYKRLPANTDSDTPAIDLPTALKTIEKLKETNTFLKKKVKELLQSQSKLEEQNKQHSESRCETHKKNAALAIDIIEYRGLYATADDRCKKLEATVDILLEKIKQLSHD